MRVAKSIAIHAYVDARILAQTALNRVRVPYLQLREATILAQSLYRGVVVRKLVPQWKKEKQQRDVRINE